MKPASLLLSAASLALALAAVPFAPADAAQASRAGASGGRGKDAPAAIGTTFCTSAPNSTGLAADLSIVGSAVAANDDVTLVVSNLPADSFAVFLTSRFPGASFSPPGSMGTLCVRRDVGRFDGAGQVRRSDGSGNLSLATASGDWSTQAIPRSLGSYPALAGTRTHFQLWYRDLVGGAPTSNFSDAEYVDWQ